MMWTLNWYQFQWRWTTACGNEAGKPVLSTSKR